MFFVSVGMLIEPAVLVANIGTVLLVMLLVGLGKALIFGGITRAFGYTGQTPLAVGFGLFQIGEFAFVLGRVGLSEGAIRPDSFAPILAAAVITMILTPFATRAAAPLNAWLERRRGLSPLREVAVPAEGLHDHTIIIGYGRVGRYTAEVFQQLKLPRVIVDQDYYAVEQAKAAGLPVIYGDATSSVVLEAAHLHSARLVLVVVSTALDVELVVRAVRQINTAVHIVVRAAHRSQVEELQQHGVHEIVQPEFEAGLEIVRQALLHFDLSAFEIEQLSDAVRHEYYESLQAAHPGAAVLAQLRRARHAPEIVWLTPQPESPLLGHSIGESAIRQRTGASIIAVLRDGQVITNSGPDTMLLPGDSFAVLGMLAQRNAFHALLEPVDEEAQAVAEAAE